MESSSLSEKEKANAERLTHKAFQLGTSKQNCGTLGPKDHQRKLISLRGDRNWKRTKADIGNYAVAQLKNSPSLVKALQ